MQPDQTDDRLQFYHCKRNSIAFQSGNYCPIGFYYQFIEITGRYSIKFNWKGSLHEANTICIPSHFVAKINKHTAIASVSSYQMNRSFYRLYLLYCIVLKIVNAISFVCWFIYSINFPKYCMSWYRKAFIRKRWMHTQAYTDSRMGGCLFKRIAKKNWNTNFSLKITSNKLKQFDSSFLIWRIQAEISMEIVYPHRPQKITKTVDLLFLDFCPDVRTQAT